MEYMGCCNCCVYMGLSGSLAGEFLSGLGFLVFRCSAFGVVLRFRIEVRV